MVRDTMNIEEFKKEKLNGIYKEVLSAKENFVEGKKEMEEQKRLTIQKDVILFFSFDVVNSTAYKTVDYYGWAHVLNRLFKVLQDEVKSKITSSQMWRVLGDEAIFIVKIKGEDELRNIINKIFVILIATVYKGNIIKNLIMDCQSYTKYRPNETTGGIFVSWRRKEELPTGA